jgi:para-nitrobenzyl esterase
MLSAALLVGGCLAAAATAQTPPLVKTSNGYVQGVIEDGVSVFHSIPFAQPPTGEARFTVPVAASPWEGTLDVSDLPNVCPQLKIDGDILLGDEDCLYLHVYLPPNAQEQGNLSVVCVNRG